MRVCFFSTFFIPAPLSSVLFQYILPPNDYCFFIHMGSFCMQHFSIAPKGWKTYGRYIDIYHITTEGPPHTRIILSILRELCGGYYYYYYTLLNKKAVGRKKITKNKPPARSSRKNTVPVKTVKSINCAATDGGNNTRTQQTTSKKKIYIYI